MKSAHSPVGPFIGARKQGWRRQSPNHVASARRAWATGSGRQL
jgi:hypothetical protein